MLRRRPISRAGDGSYRVRLSPDERQVLHALPDHLRQMLAGDDPSLVRLFPPAYVDDPERDAEYQRYMRDELVKRRLESLATLEASVDADRLSEEQLGAWLKVFTDLRLVIGTILDVSEDEDPFDRLGPDNPQAAMVALYLFLTGLQEAAITALSG